MKTTAWTIIAILLAIPTFGISIVALIFIKYKIDSFTARRVLINAIVISYENGGENEVRYHVNNAALHMVFDFFGGTVIQDFGSIVSGVLPHPRNNVLLAVTMSQTTENGLLIKATKVNNDFGGNSVAKSGDNYGQPPPQNTPSPKAKWLDDYVLKQELIFNSFEEAKAWSSKNGGKAFTRNPNGNGFVPTTGNLPAESGGNYRQLPQNNPSSKAERLDDDFDDDIPF